MDKIDEESIDATACRAVVAADSSFILFESRLAMIYALQGIAQAFVVEGNRISMRYTDRFCDAGTIECIGNCKGVRRSAYKRALAAYAYLNEVESLRRVSMSVDADILLFDGSLLSFMVTRRDVAKAMTIKSVSREQIPLGDVYRARNEAIESLASRYTLVFVAKSSTVSFLPTNSSYTDFQLLEIARIRRVNPYNEAGYTKPLEIPMSREVMRFLGIDNTKIKGFIVTYARLYRNSQVFQITVPFIDKKPDIDRVVKCLRIFSPAGYPLPLETVHRLSKLSRRSLRDFLIKIGMPISTGREFI